MLVHENTGCVTQQYSSKIMHQAVSNGFRSFKGIPTVSPGRLRSPLEGSKKTSRDDEARSSKIEAKAGGSKGLPFAM